MKVSGGSRRVSDGFVCGSMEMKVYRCCYGMVVRRACDCFEGGQAMKIFKGVKLVEMLKRIFDSHVDGAQWVVEEKYGMVGGLWMEMVEGDEG